MNWRKKKSLIVIKLKYDLTNERREMFSKYQKRNEKNKTEREYYKEKNNKEEEMN